MELREVLAARRSVRAFLDRPVEVALLERIAREAARAGTGGNVQPWHVDIVAGAAAERLKATMAARLASGVREEPAYAIYPAGLAALYRDRRFEVGEAMYARLGVARENRIGRLAWLARNFQLFGAPAGFFLTIDRAMGPPQWADLGMYLQALLLLATDAGLATCAQESWAMYPDTLHAFLDTPAERMIFCGVAVGYEDGDAAVNGLRSTRADPGEWLRVIGGSEQASPPRG